MKTNMNELLAEIDAILAEGEDTKAEKLLNNTFDEYSEAEPDDIVGQGILLNEIGSFYRKKGIFDKGEKAYLRALSLLEERVEPAYMNCSPTSENMTENYATTLNNLAGLYRMSGKLKKAIELFDEAIKEYENCREKVPSGHYASSYSNKGLVYLDLKDTVKAREMFLRAKGILEKDSDNKNAMATTLSNMGFAAVLEMNPAEATELFGQAATLFEEAGNREMAENCKGMFVKLGK